MEIVRRDVPESAAVLVAAGIHPVLARVYAARGVGAADELDSIRDEMCIQHPDERGRVVRIEIAHDSGQPYVVTAGDKCHRVGGKPERRSRIDAEGRKSHRREWTIGIGGMVDPVIRRKHRVETVRIARGRAAGRDDACKIGCAHVAIRDLREAGEREDELHRNALQRCRSRSTH